MKAYADKIAAKVRGNIILPPGVSAAIRWRCSM